MTQQQKCNTPGGIVRNESLSQQPRMNIRNENNLFRIIPIDFFQYNIDMIQQYGRQHHILLSAINTLLLSVPYKPILVYFAIVLHLLAALVGSFDFLHRQFV